VKLVAAVRVDAPNSKHAEANTALLKLKLAAD